MRPSLRRVLLALAICVHLLALYAPRVPSTGADGVPGADKLVHVAVFALVAAAGVLARVRLRVLVPVLLAHAVVSELVQHALLPNRSGDVADAVADVVGVGVGLALGRLLSPVRDRRAERGPSGPAR